MGPGAPRSLAAFPPASQRCSGTARGPGGEKTAMTWHEHTEDLSAHRDVAWLPCSPCLLPQELSAVLGKMGNQGCFPSPSRQHINFVKNPEHWAAPAVLWSVCARETGGSRSGRSGPSPFTPCSQSNLGRKGAARVSCSTLPSKQSSFQSGSPPVTPCRVDHSRHWGEEGCRPAERCSPPPAHQGPEQQRALERWTPACRSPPELCSPPAARCPVCPKR